MIPSPCTRMDRAEPHTVSVIPALRSTNHEFFDSIGQSVHLFPVILLESRVSEIMDLKRPAWRRLHTYMSSSRLMVPRSQHKNGRSSRKAMALQKVDAVSFDQFAKPITHRVHREGKQCARMCSRTASNDGTRVFESPLHPGSSSDPERTLDGDALQASRNPEKAGQARDFLH